MKWEEGYVDPKFKKNHKLTTSKTPEYHAENFLPFSRNMKGNKEMISFEKITKWEKLKAVFSGAGQGGNCYNDFRPFKVRELCQNFGLYIIHGINQSTRVEIKFKLHSVDWVNRNNFVFNNFRPNAERRNRHFK